jgi:hypothetical protein
MSDFKYQAAHPAERDQTLRDLESSNPEVVANALYSATRSEEDPKWLESECLKRLTSAELKIRWAAATCLGDLALFRRPLDAKKVIPALEAAIEDPTISDPASFSLTMVRQFSDSKE